MTPCICSLIMLCSPCECHTLAPNERISAQVPPRGGIYVFGYLLFTDYCLLFIQFLSVRGERPHSQRYSFGASPALRALTEMKIENSKLKILRWGSYPHFFIFSIVYVRY